MHAMYFARISEERKVQYRSAWIRRRLRRVIGNPLRGNGVESADRALGKV